MRELVLDSDGLGSVREYREMMARVDASMHEFAAGALQRNAMRTQQEQMVEVAPDASQTQGVTASIGIETGTGAALSTPVGATDEPDANANMLTPVQFVPPGGRGPTRPPRGSFQNLTLPEAARMIRFEGALRRLREVEPNDPQLTYVARPNTVPSEALVARLEAELAVALGWISLSQPPRPLGNQLAQPAAIERQEALISEVVNSGLKITPSAVVRIERMPDGQIVFLEQGNNDSGL